MNAEQFLNSYRQLIEDIEAIDNRIEQRRLRLEKVTASYESGGGGGGDSVSRRNNQLAAIADLGLQREQLVKDAERQRFAVDQFIGSIGGNDAASQRIRDMLQMYYVDLMTWQDVRECLSTVRRYKDGRTANRMTSVGVSEPTLWRLRREALVAAEGAWRRQGH